MRSIREILNEGNPNKLGDAAHALPLGEALALVPRTVRGVVAANVLVLPEEAKCAALLAVYATQGAVTGQFSPVPAGATPLTTEAAPDANGNVLFLGADAVTEAEVQYLAFEGGIVEDLVAVAANVGTLLGGRGAAVLLEVEALAGGAPGPKTIADRGTTPAAGNAAIQDVPTGIEFAGADAITQARVRYIAQPGLGDSPDPVSASLDDDDQSF
jgi:hypothetical protein